MAAALAQELSKLSISGTSSLEALTAAASKGPAAEIHLISHLPAVLKATADKASARDAAGRCWGRSPPPRRPALASGIAFRPVQGCARPLVVAAAMRWRVNSLPWPLGSSLFRAFPEKSVPKPRLQDGRAGRSSSAGRRRPALPPSCLATACLPSLCHPPSPAGCRRARRCRRRRSGHHVCAEPQRREAGAPCPVRGHGRPQVRFKKCSTPALPRPPAGSFATLGQPSASPWQPQAASAASQAPRC